MVLCLLHRGVGLVRPLGCSGEGLLGRLYLALVFLEGGLGRRQRLPARRQPGLSILQRRIPGGSFPLGDLQGGLCSLEILANGIHRGPGRLQVTGG